MSHNPGADCHFRRQIVTAATIPIQNATIVRLSRLSHGDNRRQYLQYKYRLYREITYNMNNCHRLSVCHFASRVVGDNRILPYANPYIGYYTCLLPNKPFARSSTLIFPHACACVHGNCTDAGIVYTQFTVTNNFKITWS